ncbi:MAG: tail fiber protein [Proteobacteria bacterium]|nr:tail fiber protein [Pseudomonadota bacterium]
MKIADIPTKYSIPFANAASAPYIAPVPVSPSATPGMASFTTGFPPLNFNQIAAGGIPPWGSDFNWMLNSITKWLRYVQAGGPLKWDSTFSTSIGGYPQGAVVQANTLGTGAYFISAVDDNTSNPNTGGANWIAWPATPIQQQKPNYGVDAGAINAIAVTLSPAPAAWADIVGAPIRVLLANTNNSTTPTVQINGLTPAVCVNADGTAIQNAQLVAGNIMEGIPRADGKFQVNYPVPVAAPPATVSVLTGSVIIWAAEAVPTGYLECAGQTLTISAYPALFNVIGNRYGGDGVTTFKLPDYRGEFLRGWDHGRGLDPNAATRTNSGNGTTGDKVGTNQGQAVGTFTSTGPFSLANPYVNAPFTSQSGPMQTFGATPGGISYNNTLTGVETAVNILSITGTATITCNGPETRPVNINVMYIIKT